MIEMLWAALAEVPGAVLVIVFLGGPTAVWIMFRVLNAPVRQRPGATSTGLLWVCASCRSANDPSRDRCYRCGVGADVDGLEVIAPDVDPGSALRPVMSPGLNLGGRAPVAVGPGKAGTQDAGAGPDEAVEAEAEEAEPVLAGLPAPRTTRPRRTPTTVDAAKPTGRARTPKPARTPIVAKDDAPVNARTGVPEPASARGTKIAAGETGSPGGGDAAGPDRAQSKPSSTP